MTRALIYGVSGQDGAYLARFLLDKGYAVFGTSRDVQASSFNNLNRLGIRNQVKLSSVAINDFRSVLLYKKLQLGNIDIMRDWGRLLNMLRRCG